MSQKAWDNVWKHLQEDDKIFYTTTYYHLGEPVEIAARYGNLDALKRLDTIYQQLLPKHQDRRLPMLLQLRTALIATPSHIKTEQQLRAYDFLLDMCGKFATLIDPNASSVGFSNKKFEYAINGVDVKDGATPLLDVFADICEKYFYEKQAIGIALLSSYIRSKGRKTISINLKRSYWFY